jgi:hypothetical protein
MEMRSRLILAVIFILAPNQTFPIPVWQSITPQSGCPLLDTSNPPQFISYDRIEEDSLPAKGKARKKVWLRLRNNTGCTVLLSAVERPRLSKWVKRPEGGLEQILLDSIPDGATIELVYDIQDNKRIKEPVNATYNHLLYEVSLPAGRSLIFSVPMKHLKDGYHIVVPFTYEWEGNKSGRNRVSHQVFFLNDDLPEEVKARERKRE